MPVPQAGPAAQILTSPPGDAATVTHWYKQSVYDPSDSKIGEIMDVLLDKQGKMVAMIVGVGGFLGMGEKEVAVPFNAVQFKTKDNNKWYAVMNATKDALKTAPGYKYDRSAMPWVPDGAATTAGHALADVRRCHQGAFRLRTAVKACLPGCSERPLLIASANRSRTPSSNASTIVAWT